MASRADGPQPSPMSKLPSSEEVGGSAASTAAALRNVELGGDAAGAADEAMATPRRSLDSALAKARTMPNSDGTATGSSEEQSAATRVRSSLPAKFRTLTYSNLGDIESPPARDGTTPSTTRSACTWATFSGVSGEGNGKRALKTWPAPTGTDARKSWGKLRLMSRVGGLLKPKAPETPQTKRKAERRKALSAAYHNSKGATRQGRGPATAALGGDDGATWLYLGDLDLSNPPAPRRPSSPRGVRNNQVEASGEVLRRITELCPTDARPSRLLCAFDPVIGSGARHVVAEFDTAQAAKEALAACRRVSPKGRSRPLTSAVGTVAALHGHQPRPANLQAPSPPPIKLLRLSPLAGG